jgi:hypothetical protein
MEILDVKEAKGSEHDLKVYKESIGSLVSSSIPIDADLGYLGIKEYHPNSFIPVKSSKNHELSEEEKGYNRELSGRRIVIETYQREDKNIQEHGVSISGTLL